MYVKIVGFVSNKKNLDLINKFVEKVEHRGPDNSDSKIIELNNKFIHLGSSRLSIRGGYQKICRCSQKIKIILFIMEKFLI